MKLLPLLSKFPKWAVAAGIIIASSAVFIGWLVFRGDGKNGSGSGNAPGAVAAFSPAEIVLCGNALVNFRSGEVIARPWLDGFGDSLPPVSGFSPDEKLVIATSGGVSVAYGLDGRQKPALSADGKPVGAVAFSGRQAVFVRDGNLWKGRVDWGDSTVSDLRKVTDTGFFRDDTFRHAWLWAGDELYLHILGRPHVVSLEDGKTKPNQPPIERLLHGVSPDRKLVAFGMRMGEFAVAEFGTEDIKRFPTLGDVTKVVWVSPGKVAVIGHYRKISIYDHGEGKVVADYQLENQPQFIGGVSPDRKTLLLGDREGIRFMDIATGKSKPVSHPVMQAAWASATSLLCSNTSTDTDLRGVWLVNLDGTKERVSSQPIDAAATRGANAAVEISGGVLFVSGGDLWRFDSRAKSLNQITHGQKLPANLKLLQAK